jgi:ATP-dependent Lon protease
MPLFPLDLALLPNGQLPLHIFEERYRKMITRCVEGSSSFGIVRVHDDTLAAIGTEGSVQRVLHRYPDGRFNIVVVGGERIRILRVRNHEDGYLEAEVEKVAETPEDSDHALEDRLVEEYRRYAVLQGDIPQEAPARGPRWSFRLADRMRLSVTERQSLLETFSENERMRRLEIYIREHIPVLIEKGRNKRVARGNGRLRSASARSAGAGPKGEKP